MSGLMSAGTVTDDAFSFDELGPLCQPRYDLGRVQYIGVPFGNADLLTLSAVRALSEADIVVLDSPALATLLDQTDLALPERRLMTVDDHDSTEARAALVAREAGLGRTVVRLVTGDPLTETAIGQEARLVAALGTPIDIVPAVAALTAVPTLVGLDIGDEPPTYRGFKAGESLPEGGSLVLDVNIADLPALYQAALAAGHCSGEPAVVTFELGTPRQRTRTVKLKDLTTHTLVQGQRPGASAAVVIGQLARRDECLDTYETKPLFGWNVLVPRTAKATDEIDRHLRRYGASSYAVPTITVELPRNPLAMDKAIHGLVDGRYRWIVFTSGNAVRAVLEKLEEYGLDARAFSGLHIAAMSQMTAGVLTEWGIVADLVPQVETGAGLVSEFPAYEQGLDIINRVFLPRADIALDSIVEGVARLGWEAEEVTAYRAVRAAPPPIETRDAIKSGLFDAVVFTSSSTVRNLLGIAGKPPRQTVIAAIGPATAATCQELGLHVDVMAEVPEPRALVDALAEFARQRRADLRARGRDAIRPSESRRRRVAPDLTPTTSPPLADPSSENQG